MKKSITHRIACAAVLISCVALFQNCGPAKVSTSETDAAGTGADLGSNTPNSPPAGAPVTGPTAAAFSASQTTLDFGAVDYGDTSSAQVVTVTNTGNANLTLTRTLVGDDFSFANGNLTNVCTDNISLAPGQRCSLGTRFSPFFSDGIATGMIWFSSNAPNSPHLIQLTGHVTTF